MTRTRRVAVHLIFFQNFQIYQLRLNWRNSVWTKPWMHTYICTQYVYSIIHSYTNNSAYLLNICMLPSTKTLIIISDLNINIDNALPWILFFCTSFPFMSLSLANHSMIKHLVLHAYAYSFLNNMSFNHFTLLILLPPVPCLQNFFELTRTSHILMLLVLHVLTTPSKSSTIYLHSTILRLDHTTYHYNKFWIFPIFNLFFNSFFTGLAWNLDL